MGSKVKWVKCKSEEVCNRFSGGAEWALVEEERMVGYSSRLERGNFTGDASFSISRRARFRKCAGRLAARGGKPVVALWRKMQAEECCRGLKWLLFKLPLPVTSAKRAELRAQTLYVGPFAKSH